MTRFDKNSTVEQVSEGIDLSGQTAIVTGANTGIGFETIRVLAKRHIKEGPTPAGQAPHVSADFP